MINGLKQSRDGHGAITSGSLTMIIGGSSGDEQPWVMIKIQILLIISINFCLSYRIFIQ